MTKCPKCGQKLHLYNVSQFCPSCKVNLRFCNFEENFIKEAKEAELKLATFHVKIRHMKIAFIGNKFSIIRLVAVVFTILGLLVPAGTLNINLPFFSESIGLNGIGLYNIYSNGIVAFILKMSSSSLCTQQFVDLRNVLLMYASMAVFAVAIFLSTLLCFISYKNMPKVIAGIAAAGMIDSIVCGFVVNSIIKKFADVSFISAKSSVGFYIEALMFLLVIVANVLLLIKMPKVEYEEGDLERHLINQKVKKGEIDFDSLPLPIVETEETRQIEEEIKKGMMHFEDDEGRKEIEEGETDEAVASSETQE